jgi:hypothetical protein
VNVDQQTLACDRGTREKPDARPTARFEYDTAICSKCKTQEWICKCDQDKKK